MSSTHSSLDDSTHTILNEKSEITRSSSSNNNNILILQEIIQEKIHLSPYNA